MPTRHAGSDRRSSPISARIQTICLWGGPLSLFLVAVGFCLLAGMVPPPSPHDSAREIQAMYRDNTDLIRLGLFLTTLAGPLQGPFFAVISAQMRRVEGCGPLASTQLGMGMLGIVFFIIPPMLMQAAAFRPGRDPDLILLLNDAAWLPFVGVIGLFVVQNLVIALCVFSDTEQRVFPRWLGYLNLWVVLLTLPAGLIYFFKTGPFAWNGILPFWIPLPVFFVWFIVMFVVTRKAVLAEAAEEAAGLHEAQPG